MSPALYYLPLLHLHVTLVSISLALFALRGAGVLAARAWPLRPLWRRTSVVVDTGLLLAGASLWTLLHLNPIVQTWLGVKLLLVVAYIVLGVFALKRAPTRRGKAGFYIAALACAGWVVCIAVAHHPGGPLRLLGWI